MLRYPIIVKNSIVPKLFSVFINVYAIALFPFVFVRDKGNTRTFNHESIHFRQQRELFVLFFYFLYVWDWIAGLVKYRSVSYAYARIRFEQEAYDNEHNDFYLIARKRNSWKKYKV